MKKIKITAALCALLLVSKAQPGSYGQTTYGHSLNTELSSGLRLTGIPGFLMAGNIQTISSPGQFNFYLDKTDVDGNYTGLGVTDFSEEYVVSVKPTAGCVGTVAQITNCYGVSAIKNNPALSGGALTSTVRYLVAGTTDLGIFYVGIDASGVAVQTGNYQFPTGAAAGQYKPKIIQFSTGGGNVGHYYICGSYTTTAGVGTMYLLKINDSGTLLTGGSMAYDIGGIGTTMEGYDMLESPYTAGYLIIVGSYLLLGDTEAFLMEFDDGTVSVTNFIDYDNGGFNDSFNSINVKSSTNVASATAGFIIGGATDINNGNPNPGICMMHYVDNAYTSNGCWAITPTTDNQGGKIVAVLERSNLSAVYENYGLCTTQNGMTVVKLDDAGAAWGTPPNEFLYNTQQKSVGVNITDFNTPGGPNLGVHVFGTYYSGGAAVDGYLVQACFNGYTGCTSSETLTTLQNVAVLTPTPPANSPSASGSILTACTGMAVSQSSGPAGIALICGQTLTGLPTSGSNARLSAITAVEKSDLSAFNVGVFPNPASDIITIQFLYSNSGEVTLEVENNLGELVGSFIIAGKDADSPNKYVIDIGSMNLNNGIYFAKITADGKTYAEKLLISK